jgi:gliding motility-associated-like protein
LSLKPEIIKNNCIKIFFALLVFLPLSLNAQLGFCGGNSGEQIFTEDFGSGTQNVALPAGTTTYTFANTQPNDGYYTVSNRTNWFDWHDIQDHTTGDTNGRSLVVNADFTAGEFYKTAISGLCENTSYEFSSWIINLMPSNHPFCGTGIPINVKFEIWDNTDTNLLASGDTGNINSTSSPNWEQYGLVFKTLPNQTSIILKMLNNGVGGCGNDLAIDDIVFKSCGDNVTVTDNQNSSEVFICEGDPSFSTVLNANPDFSIFTTHFYQWQQSNDGINWIDIIGETNATFTTPILNDNIFYRVKVAEDAINISNSFCNTLSDIFEFGIVSIPEAPISNGNISVCGSSTTSISVSTPSDVIVNWYDAPFGGNLLLSESNSYSTQTSGIYYAEAETPNGGCISTTRTPVTATFFEIPLIENEELSFCENTTITLYADTNIPTATYLWSTGAITEEITVDTSGLYTVDVTNVNCTVTKSINLTQKDIPVINTITSDGRNIVVTITNEGDFLYSLDGFTYQENNTFYNVEGGLYTIYTKGGECNDINETQYLHFYIPKFFTPNGDGINDVFELKGIEFYTKVQVSIFNRYGKLLKNSTNSLFSWDGTYNNKKLPTNDYWYIIIIDNQKFTGHFTLIRK